MPRFHVVLAVVMIVVVSVVVPSGLVTEAQGPDLVTISYVQAEQVPYRSVDDVFAYVTVSRSDGNPVTGLSVKDFSVIQDGQKVLLMAAEQTDEPISVVLVIDTSRSMSATDSMGRMAMDSAKEAARVFVDALDENDRVAVYSFDREANLLQDLSIDHGAAINAIYGMEYSENRTCLYDAAMTAMAKASESPKGRRAIVLFTDGKDEVVIGGNKTAPASTHTFADVIDTATSPTRSIPIYTVGLASGQIDEQELARMATRTGGRAFVADSPEDLPGQFERIEKQMHSQYRLHYQTDAPNGEHSIVVKLDRAGSPMDERLFYIPARDLPTSPKVIITSPVPGAPVAAPVEVALEITPVERVAKVSYFIDDMLVGELTKPPFGGFSLDSSMLEPGRQELRVELTDLDNKVVSAKTTLSVPAPTSTATPIADTPTPTATPTDTATPTHTPDTTATAIARATEIQRIVEATAAARALLTAQAQQTAAALTATAEAGETAAAAATATVEARLTAEASILTAEAKQAAAAETAAASTATARAEGTATSAVATVWASQTAAAVEAERTSVAATVTTQARLTADVMTAVADAATSVAATATGHAVATADSETATAIAILTVEAGWTPTPTPSMTPTPTPTLSFVQGLTQTLQEGNPPNYVFAGIFLVLLIAGVVLILMGVVRKRGSDDVDLLESDLAGGDISTGYYESQWDTGSAPGRDDAATGDVEVGSMTEDVMPSASLVVERSLELKEGQRFQLTRSTTMVGRGSHNDFDIPDKPVSREHAEIEYDGQSFRIRDRGSRFGTKVNRQDVSSRGMPLHNGATIQLGTRTTLRFEWESDETSDISEVMDGIDEDLDTQEFRRSRSDGKKP